MVDSSSAVTFDKLPSVVALKKHYDEVIAKKHLRDYLGDELRNEKLRVRAFDQKAILDFTHVKIDQTGIDLLMKVAEETKLHERVAAMFNGEVINKTEKRSVLHVALRMAADKELIVNEVNVVAEVEKVRSRIAEFSAQIRDGTFKGHTGKDIKNIVAIGIGGSFLGPEFVYEALRTHSEYNEAMGGRRLIFLANVDPIDFFKAMQGVDIEETLFIVVSKTFTTAETMLNAATCKNAIEKHYRAKHPSSSMADVLKAHLAAVSTNLKATEQFGIESSRVFGFWDWVGGRYSVSSAVGLLPLSLVFGFDKVNTFLEGLRSGDNEIQMQKDYDMNAHMMLGLIGFYNTYICGYESRALLPYCQALTRFPAHIQQLDMESNGKSVAIDGTRLDAHVGPIVFGEPGTNGQHSFYQLMHQGRVIPSEFIGFTASQNPVQVPDFPVASHDELMANFFAQPDALAIGKTPEQLREAGVPEELVSHKTFLGDRPSLSILFKGCLDGLTCGQLLSLYEHRVAIEGFIYNINSFDQWGVELGKALAKDVRAVFSAVKGGAEYDLNKFNAATQVLLHEYIIDKQK